MVERGSATALTSALVGINAMANPVTWFEIMGQDSATLQKFYADIFGWKLSPPIPEMGNYSMLDNAGQGIGGGLGQGDRRVTVYIQVDDPQAYLDRITGAGGQVLMPVTSVTPETTIAMFADPAGNVTGLLKAT
jgi:predicted enzyme related to lactoylglutathione lyase